MDDIWQHAESFGETNGRMLEEQALCDVTFLVGQSKTPVKSHKFILASRSPVFYAMFCGSMAEPASEIPIPDAEEDIFRIFLKAVYTGLCEVNADTVMSLIYTAKKYDVPCIQRSCKEYLDANLDTDNVCTVLEQAVIFDEEPLQKTCLSLIAKETTKVLQTSAFLSLSKPALQVILESECIECTEDVVYMACKKWAAQACCKSGMDSGLPKNLRQALEGLLHLIRFPAMDVGVFAEGASNDGILSPKETISIFQDISLKRNCSSFKCSERKRPKQTTRIIRVGEIGQGWKHSGWKDAINFQVNSQLEGSSITLKRVALFLPMQQGDQISGTLKICENDTTLLEQTVTLKNDSNDKYEWIKLSKSVCIRQGITYQLQQLLIGPTIYYGEGGLSYHQQDGLALTFSKCDSPNGTVVQQGQFYGLEFNH